MSTQAVDLNTLPQCRTCKQHDDNHHAVQRYRRRYPMLERTYCHRRRACVYPGATCRHAEEVDQ